MKNDYSILRKLQITNRRNNNTRRENKGNSVTAQNTIAKLLKSVGVFMKIFNLLSMMLVTFTNNYFY